MSKKALNVSNVSYVGSSAKNVDNAGKSGIIKLDGVFA